MMLLNRLPLLILAAIGVVVLFSLLSNGFAGLSDEISSCDSDSTKATIVNSMVTKVKDAASSSRLGSAPAGAPAQELLDSLQSWTATVNSIRQLRYDEKNDIRYCEAEIAHRNLPVASIMAMQLLGIKANVCLERFKYQIQNLSNGQGQYVSWTCED